MTDDPPAPDAPDAPGATPIYTIRVQGHVGPRLTDRLDPLRPRHESDGTTTLTGPVADQAALHGLLRRIRDLGLPLVAVVRRAAEDANATDDAQSDEADDTPPPDPRSPGP
jgi:hypothetical protein